MKTREQIVIEYVFSEEEAKMVQNCLLYCRYRMNKYGKPIAKKSELKKLIEDFEILDLKLLDLKL